MATGSAGEPPVKHILFLALMAGLIGWLALSGKNEGDTPPVGRGMQATARFRVATAERVDGGAAVEAAGVVLANRLRGLGANRVDVEVHGNDITCRTWGLDWNTSTMIFGAESGAAPGTLPSREMMEMLCARGTVQFLIEVRTPGDVGAHSRRTRPPIWSGSPAEFRAYKLAEIVRWRAALAASPNAAYEPGNPKFRVVRKRGRTGGEPYDFRVVEIPEDPAHIIDGTHLENPRVSVGSEGRPILVVSVKADAQAGLRAFTERNIGLPMTIVVNGECIMAPMIQDALSDSIQITVGGVTITDALAEARVLVAALQSGVLQVPVTFVSLTADPAAASK